jgi:hypothetical protein
LLFLDLPEYSPDKLLEGNVIQEVLTSSVVSVTFLTQTEYIYTQNFSFKWRVECARSFGHSILSRENTTWPR